MAGEQRATQQPTWSAQRGVTQPPLQRHGGCSSNYETATAPLETRFPISPKTGRGRGSRLCFIMIGQITADRLVYAFLTSLITAEGGRGGEKKNPRSAATGSRRTYGSSDTLKGGVVYTGIIPAGVIFLQRHFM